MQRLEPKLEDSTEETGHKEAGKEVEVEEGFIEYVVDVTVAYPGGEATPPLPNPPYSPLYHNVLRLAQAS